MTAGDDGPTPDDERASFELRLPVAAGLEATWQRLWDLAAHTRSTPLTRVRSLDGTTLRRGSRFVATTRLGPWRLHDRMVVREWDPPHRAVIDKLGPLPTGTIRVEVSGRGGATLVVWRQSYGARGVPDCLAALLRRPVAAGYAHTLRRILGPVAGRGASHPAGATARPGGLNPASSTSTGHADAPPPPASRRPSKDV